MIGWRIDILEPALRPDLADACAAWNHGMWGAPRGTRLDASLRQFHDLPRSDALPMTLVAVATEGAVPGAAMGMASLWEHDGAGTEDRTPWLASVFVHPTARKAGLGAALVTRAEEEAARLEVSTLNLFTTDAVVFYERLGWSVRQVAEDRVFMEKALGPPAAPVPRSSRRRCVR